MLGKAARFDDIKSVLDSSLSSLDLSLTIAVVFIIPIGESESDHGSSKTGRKIAWIRSRICRASDDIICTNDRIGLACNEQNEKVLTLSYSPMSLRVLLHVPAAFFHQALGPSER